MWSRTRIHETGILLSIGIRKISIISQYITEVLLIAVIAFLLSYFPATVVADQAGSYLQNVPDLDIQIQSEEMLMLFVFGIGMVVISASLSSISIMRLKPREILTKMS